MREIQKREGMRYVIYTDLLSSMLAIENNRENYPILNQIYYLLEELYNRGKQITLCKIPAHMIICLSKYRDDMRLMRSAGVKYCLIVIDEFDAG